MNKKDAFFWTLTAAVFVILILPDLFMDGMFADGTQYACVSKNLAEGIGSFWFPYLSDTWHKAGSHAFMEQPPLMYAIQAPFFKILGNGLYTERIYILLTALFTAFIIHKIWRKFSSEKYRHLSWLPILFWLCIPLMSWTYRQNMQENTMGMFTILAIYFGLSSIYTKQRIVLYSILTGISIFLATFTKGIPGLFPITIAGIAWIFSKQLKFSGAVLRTLIYIAVPCLIYCLLLLNETAHESLTFYFKSRLMSRVESSPVVESHFYMAGRLALELAPSLLLLILIYLSAKIKNILPRKGDIEIEKGLILFILGLAGSLPLMLTLVQRGFYMSISFPCFALAFSYFTAPALHQLYEHIHLNTKMFNFARWTVCALFAAGMILTIFQAGKPGRDKDLLADVYTLGEYLEPYQRISCDGPSYHHFPFQFYMLRYFDVYLEKSPRELAFYMVEKNSKPPHPELYSKVEAETSRYDLYERK